jgi:hypothetical protein
MQSLIKIKGQIPVIALLRRLDFGLHYLAGHYR